METDPPNWPAARAAIEHRAVALNRQQPRRKLSDCVTAALAEDSALWRAYRQAIGAGEPEEFRRWNERRPDTPKEQAWQRIDAVARSLVAVSAEPLTLRSAVIKTVQTRPDLFRAMQVASDEVTPSRRRAKTVRGLR